MIIGLSGRAGVGKTTIAKMLEKREGFVIRTYAYPLKKSLSALTGLSINYFTDIRLKEEVIDWIGKSPRQMMQMMGTEFVRNMVHPDFWTNRMRETLNRMDSTVNVVIDDCRFENETQLIRDLGGQIVHLRREYACPTKEINHQSERPLKIQEEDIGIRVFDQGPETTYRFLMEAIHENLRC